MGSMLLGVLKPVRQMTPLRLCRLSNIGGSVSTRLLPALWRWDARAGNGRRGEWRGTSRGERLRRRGTAVGKGNSSRGVASRERRLMYQQARESVGGHGKLETRRNPWSLAGCNRLAGTRVEKGVEAVRNREDETGVGSWQLRARTPGTSVRGGEWTLR